LKTINNILIVYIKGFDFLVIQKMTNEAQNYGPIFRIWLTLLPYVVLIEPEDIQIILSSMTRDIDKWKIHRKILQPAFHCHVLERFIGTFSECANRLVDKLLEKNEEDINVTVFVNNSVYDILIGT